MSGNGVDFRNNNENTMDNDAINSSHMCVERLKRRYADIDFEHCITELCYFLRRNGVRNADFDRFRVAERAIYPDFGAVGLNSLDNMKHALYYWMAANDEGPDMISSPADRRACYVRALYECQRGNNARSGSAERANSAQINFRDNHATVDQTICPWGVDNKFAEVFVGMHPDIVLVVELNNTVNELFYGFVIDACLTSGASYQQMRDIHFDFANIIIDRVQLDITSKIRSILSIISDTAGEAAINRGLDYLQASFSAIDAIDFSSKTVAHLTNLRANALEQLTNARNVLAAQNGDRAAPNFPAAAEPEYDSEAIKDIARQILPQPDQRFRSALYINRGDGVGLENRFFDNGTTGIRYTPPQTMTNWWTGYYNLPRFSFGGAAPTQDQLEASMRPQPFTTTAAQAQTIRENRMINRNI